MSGDVSRRSFLTTTLMGGAAVAAGASFGPFKVAQAADGSLVFVASSASRAAHQKILERFGIAFPGVSVRDSYSDTDRLQTTIRVQLGSGRGPDVFTVWPGSGNPLSTLQLGPAGFLADLSNEPYAANIPPQFEKVMRFDGKLGMLTTSASFITCCANLETFEKVGIDKFPDTWSGFLEMCQKIKDAGIIPLALGMGTPWNTQLIPYGLVPTTVYARDADFDAKMRNGEVKFVDSGWREAIEKFVVLKDRGFFNDNPNGTSYETSLQLLGAGKAAMTVQTTNGISGIYNFSSHRRFELFPLPGSDIPDENWVSSSPSNGLGVNAKARNAEAALEYLRFFAEPEQVATYSELVRQPPILPITGEASSGLFDNLLPFMTAGKTSLFPDNLWPNPRVQQTLFRSVQELFGGSITVDDVLKNMDSAYKAA